MRILDLFKKLFKKPEVRPVSYPVLKADKPVVEVRKTQEMTLSQIKFLLIWFGDNACYCRFPQTQKFYLDMWSLAAIDIFRFLKKTGDPDGFLKWLLKEDKIDPEIKEALKELIKDWKPYLLTN